MLKLAYLLAAVLAAASIAAAAPAQATPDDPDANDKAFIQELRLVGVPLKSESHAIQTGLGICRDMYSGHSVQEILADLDSTTGLNGSQVRLAVYISWRFYCPEFTRVRPGP